MHVCVCVCHGSMQGTNILEPMLTDVVSMCCHPTQPELMVLGRGGMLQRWDLIKHECITSRKLVRAAGSRVAYSRDGSFVVVGLDMGFVKILSTEDLSDIFVTRNTPNAIVQLAAATTGRHVACADDQNQVLLYAFLPYKHIMRWEFVGKTFFAFKHHSLHHFSPFAHSRKHPPPRTLYT